MTTALLLRPDELRSYSVSGRQANAFAKFLPAKPAIPRGIKAAIDFIVKQVHPGLKQKDIDKAIATKLNMATKPKRQKRLGDNNIQNSKDLVDSRYETEDSQNEDGHSNYGYVERQNEDLNEHGDV